MVGSEEAVAAGLLDAEVKAQGLFACWDELILRLSIAEDDPDLI